MKKFVLILTVLGFITGSAVIADDHEDHKVVHSHDHKHDAKCGHKAEKHGDHTDYEEKVDGKIHHHKAHGDHFDECEGPKHG